jgi:hypothetical protein
MAKPRPLLLILMTFWLWGRPRRRQSRLPQGLDEPVSILRRAIRYPREGLSPAWAKTMRVSRGDPRGFGPRPKADRSWHAGIVKNLRLYATDRACRRWYA